jgi:hypothetical protein
MAPPSRSREDYLWSEDADDSKRFEDSEDTEDFDYNSELEGYLEESKQDERIPPKNWIEELPDDYPSDPENIIPPRDEAATPIDDNSESDDDYGPRNQEPSSTTSKPRLMILVDEPDRFDPTYSDDENEDASFPDAYQEHYRRRAGKYRLLRQQRNNPISNTLQNQI